MSAAIGVLAILAVGLTAMALQRVNATPDGGEVAPVPTFSQQPAPDPTPTASAAAPASYERAEERFLAVSEGALWRGVAGVCGTVEPLLERSIDDGATWTDVTPRYLGIGQLLAVAPFAGDQAEIVAAMGDDCEVQALRTFTQGQFWAPNDEALASSAYIDPADSSTVVLPRGRVAAPCADSRGLRTSADQVALLCDGIAYAMGADAEWRPLPATGAAAVGFDGGRLVVARVEATCAGLTLTDLPSEDTAASSDLACADAASAAAPSAVAVTAGRLLVWSGDDWTVLER